MTHPREAVFIDAWELRRIFGADHLLERLERGELTPVIRREGHPSPPLAGEPICTRSQVIAYIDATGARIATVHQYLRPDGTVGLSGKPDPILILHEGIVYKRLTDH